MPSRDELAARIRSADGESQLHLLDGYDELPADQQATFAAQLERIFVPGMVGPTTVFQESLKMSNEPPQDIKPPTASDLMPVSPDSAEGRKVAADGLRLLASGRGAVVVLAGGSGTRLGVSFPKGMLECPDLAAKKSLFQLHCEKIRRVEELAAEAAGAQNPVRIPLVYMTSPATDETTRNYIADHKYFGLGADQILFCCQSTMPCFSADGKIILSKAGTVAEAPGGNAGVYGALGESGVLDELKKRGVEYCQVVTVDNLLVRLADPIFFGVAARSEGKLDVAVKAVTKAHDHEAVGVFARRSYPAGATAVDATLSAIRSLWGVVEYTEIGKELAAAKNDAGARLFDCGNVGIHLFSTRFLTKAANAMRAFSYYHVARKPIPTQFAESKYGAEAGSPSVAGVKLEAFIFDLFLLVDPSSEAGAFNLIQVERSEEFSAIKNADDPAATAAGAEVKRDSPASAVRDMHRSHAAWVRAAVSEVSVPGVTAERVPERVELSPLVVATGAAELAGRLSSNEGFRSRFAAAFEAYSGSGPLVISEALVSSL